MAPPAGRSDELDPLPEEDAGRLARLDFLTPLSFVWPVFLMLPVLLFISRLPEREPALRSVQFFIGTFYVWLPFYLMYLAVFAVLTSLRVGTWLTAFISAAVALALACSWWYFGGIAFRFF